MAIIKCKMCGGDLALMEGQSVAKCEFCGTTQTVPKVDDEKKLALFARANRLRAACEFDKAAGIYESIVADFPEEAEAYWGLVLCKYGIEYVDDPGTGKKVPTCHRTLPSPLPEDPDYREALSKADVLSKRLYQTEAEQIDQIQQKILNIVAREEPYDIFICYKETDDDTLRRTEDSADAQDLFTELTKDGYRVFFARNTLKTVAAGSEYEPYIYAALSSAKVMLVIGSCEEYFNAVWVKNEWARFLDMMKTQQGKVLIPCYKHMDPYDMPREFRNLQALNMTDLTFYPTLKANLERAIPRQKAAPVVVQEQVVVGSAPNNKVAALLERGNMALEDGDWEKADSFFEDVLNNDPKNAQAYIGKTLAQEKCRTLDAFIRKRKAAYNVSQKENRRLTPEDAHICAIVEENAVSGYLEKAQLRKLYEFDLTYSTHAPAARQHYKSEQDYWTNHKLLSRAEKFAQGDVAQNLEAEKQVLFSWLSEQITKAESAENSAKEAVQRRYAAHITEIDGNIALLHQRALKDLENDYQKWLMEAKNEFGTKDLNTQLQQYRKAAEFFEVRKNYQDSAALADHCRKRIGDIQAVLVKRRAEEAEEAERRRIAEEKAAEERRIAEEKAAEERRIAAAKAATKKKKRAIITASIVVAIVLVCVVCVAVLVTVVIPNNKYNEAVAMMERGEYDNAIAAFTAMDGYKDSDIQICKIYHAQGIQEMEAGNYESALELFEAASQYVDVVAEQDNCYYQMALDLICQGKGSGKEYLTKIQNANAFPDYQKWNALCELHEAMNDIIRDDIESKADVRAFNTTLSETEEIIEKLNVNIELSDYWIKLRRNIELYGKYLNESGKYTTLFSDGSDGGYASLTITTVGLQIYGCGPMVYLSDGELSETHTGNAYYNADSYVYTLLEDGSVEIQETKKGTTKTHYILPVN